MHDRADDIVAEAKRHVGVRWRHLGRDPATGLDCAGLIVRVAQDLDLVHYDTTAYSRRPNSTEFRRAMLEAGMIPVAPREHGDVLRLAAPKWPVHVGFLEVDDAGVEWLIHAWADARKVVREHLTETKLLQIREIMRFPE